MTATGGWLLLALGGAVCAMGLYSIVLLFKNYANREDYAVADASALGNSTWR